MRTLVLIFSIILLGSYQGQAQSKKAIKYYEKAKKADNEGDVSSAIKYLNKALDSSPEYVEANLFLADIYKGRGNRAKSLEYYESLIQNYNAPYFVYLFYGETLYEMGRYADAKSAFQEYLKSPRVAKKYRQRVNDYLDDCDFSISAVANPKSFAPINLGPQVNSENKEYFPCISADGNTLVFTHRAPKAAKSDEDFYVTSRDSSNGEWNKAQPLRGFLNTQFNEGAPSITADGSIIYFAACDRMNGYGSCDIYASFNKGNGEWSKPVNLGDSVNSRVWDSQPSISPDGRTLYFVRGSSVNSKNIDIYYAELRDNGRWGKAKKLRGKVNTKEREISPFIHFDNQTLYFSSNGHPGMGDLDFFISRKQANGAWGEPENIGHPINSAGEEFSIIVGPDGKTGFFSSDGLDGNYGDWDLYSFEMPKEYRAIEIAYIKGRITNKKTGDPISAKLEFSELETAETVLVEKSNRRGKYFSVLPGNSDYALNIQKKGFLVYSKNFSLATEKVERAFELNAELIPIEIGEKVKLENVFFNTSSYELDSRSYAELNKVVDFLNENPSVKMSVEGHTDNQGTKSFNATLSKNRAKAVFNYLVDNGIDSSRLSSKGFGDSQPVADNGTEEGRKLNRRTEVQIIAF